MEKIKEVRKKENSALLNKGRNKARRLRNLSRCVAEGRHPCGPLTPTPLYYSYGHFCFADPVGTTDPDEQQIAHLSVRF